MPSVTSRFEEIERALVEKQQAERTLLRMTRLYFEGADIATPAGVSIEEWLHATWLEAKSAIEAYTKALSSLGENDVEQKRGAVGV